MSILKLIAGLLPNFVKGVAEGQYGEPLKKLYWAAAGKKTVTALVFAILYGVGQVAVNVFGQCVPECATAESVAQAQWVLDLVITYIVPLLVTVGLFDGAIRLEPPKKEG